jgi:hypothetical protein
MLESETPRMLKRERNGGNKCEEGNEKEATAVRVQENRQRGIKANGRPGPGPSLPPPLLTRSGREGGRQAWQANLDLDLMAGRGEGRSVG